MKHLNILLAVFAVTAGAAQSQPPGPPAGGPLDIERLAILLDLDAYQKSEVERVLTEQRETRRAAREQLAASDAEPPSREGMQARRVQDREELFGKLRNTLTELQLQKLELLMQPSPGMRGPRAAPF